MCPNKQCYVDAYESVDSDKLPEVVRVKKIFSKLRAVVGTKETISAELLIIESDGRPWALSLSDQTIVLTTGAIEIFYSEGDKELGDTRAAFVLGHELAHITNQDLFHAKAFNGERNYALNIDLFNQEMRADINGFTYATIAGFNTPRLLGGKAGFFQYWAEQLPLVEGLKHPGTLKRSENLQLAFNEIVDEIPFYRLGMVLAHSGRYKDAKNILTDYLKNGGAKTKELYVNLGYTHLQLARAAMPEKQAYKYWIPTLLEIDTLELNRGMFGGKVGASALAHLEKAEEYLEIALDMDDNDYTALVNLTAVYLYKPDSLHKAYAAIKSALNLNLASEHINQQLLSIYHLVRLADDYDGGDRWTATKNWYQQEIAKQPVDDNIIYNMARMLDDRGRDDTAERYWMMLLEQRSKLPRVYRERTCIRMSMSKKECHAGSEIVSPKAWPVSHIPIGIDVRESYAKQCLSEHWQGQILERNVGETQVKIYTDKSKNEVIALDNFLEVYLKRDVGLASEFGTVDRISNVYGSYLSSQPAGVDGLALYKFRGASALVHNGYVKELWITELPSAQAIESGCG
jgi:tetratricopeptide (TPR) repeat protein